MTGLNLSSPAIHPPPEPDPLGSALVTALRRDIGRNLSWAWPVILVGGLATAGLMPLIILLLRFRTFATSEKFHLEHVTEWVQTRGLPTERLESATRDLARRWPALTRLGLVLSGFALLLAGYQVIADRFSGDSLLSLLTIYRPGGLASMYMLLLIVGYAVCLGLAVKRHARSVADYVAAFHECTGTAPSADDRIAEPGWPGWPWTLCGFVLLAAGCLWGLPMMLAAGAHRRYINDISARVRGQVADRIAAVIGGDGLPPSD